MPAHAPSPSWKQKQELRCARGDLIDAVKRYLSVDAMDDRGFEEAYAEMEKAVERLKAAEIAYHGIAL